jgi:hypothetical protein
MLARRALLCLFSATLGLAVFYASLIKTSQPLNSEQRTAVREALGRLEQAGFDSDVFLLKRIAVYRSTDHWFNATAAKESAFAATNYPFQIVTLYADLFTYPADDVERAAILLHEARHLRGEGEKEAYAYVWRNRARLGWTSASYGASVVWQEIRKQTADHSPELFVCPDKPFLDCTED